jgi:hypothetical protein
MADAAQDHDLAGPVEGDVIQEPGGLRMDGADEADRAAAGVEADTEEPGRVRVTARFS